MITPKFELFISDVLNDISGLHQVVFSTHCIEKYHRAGNVPLLAQSLREQFNTNNYGNGNETYYMSIYEAVQLAKTFLSSHII